MLPGGQRIRSEWMRKMGGARGLMLAAGVAVVLGGCAQQAERPPQAAAAAPAAVDDDTYCQSKGLKPGSDDYAKCLRDRDYSASLRAKRDGASQQKLGDFMMDHR